MTGTARKSFKRRQPLGDYSDTRIRLLRRHTNVRRWALHHHFPVGSVYNAIRFARNGAESNRIRSAMETYLNERP